MVRAREMAEKCGSQEGVIDLLAEVAKAIIRDRVVRSSPEAVEAADGAARVAETLEAKIRVERVSRSWTPWGSALFAL